MDIEDAFTQEAIAAMDTNVEGDEEEQLRDTIQRVYSTNELELTHDHENVAVLCFVAGRTYQQGIEVSVPMSLPMLLEFNRFMMQRGQT